MKNNQLCVHYDCAQHELADRLAHSYIGLLFVVRDNQCIGFISKEHLKGGLSRDGLVCDVCDTDVVVIPEHSSEKYIAEVLVQSSYDFLPIVSSDGAVVDVAGLQKMERIPVLEPHLAGNERKYVTECVESNWVSSQGRFVTQFEAEIGNYTNSEYVLAVSNGTVALHLALVCLDIGPGDEVLVPEITFGATLNAVKLTGATPVIIDVSPESWNIDFELIEAAITSKTKVIMPVHIYGVPCQMDKIMDLAKRKGIAVVEDCAEALGAKIDTSHVGTFGDVGTFSFFGNKVITCGEGGALLFRSRELYEKAKILRDHGMRPGKRYWHDVVGFNYRLTNLQAALGVAQMEQLPGFRRKRMDIFSWYEEFLIPSGYFKKQLVDEIYQQSFWLFSVKLKSGIDVDRNLVIEHMSSYGVDVRPVFFPMSMMPAFEGSGMRLNGTGLDISKQGLSLPSSVTLTKSQVERISGLMIGIVERLLDLKKLSSDA